VRCITRLDVARCWLCHLSRVRIVAVNAEAAMASLSFVSPRSEPCDASRPYRCG
jgi:hypothetical protein